MRGLKASSGSQMCFVWLTWSSVNFFFLIELVPNVLRLRDFYIKYRFGGVSLGTSDVWATSESIRPKPRSAEAEKHPPLWLRHEFPVCPSPHPSVLPHSWPASLI